MFSRAWRWLAQHQADDGRWDSDRLGGGPHYDVGVTGLALLAFTGAGVPHAYRENVARAAAWLKAQQNDGLIGAAGHRTALLQHAIATTALGEVTATMAGYDDAVRKAVAVIVAARNPDMAWSYTPRGGKNDTFTTAWMVTALRTAEVAGFEVDHEAYAGALEWIDKMTDPNFGQVGYNYPGGTVARLRADGSEAEWIPNVDFSQACTAAGLWVRGLVTRRWRGWRHADLSRKSYSLIGQQTPKWTPADGHVDLCYWHWGALATEQVARSSRMWRRSLEKAIGPHQKQDGSWDPVGAWGKEGGRVFSTATCVLALLAPASHPHDVLNEESWQERHATAFKALRKALAHEDPRVRAAAEEFADLVR